MTVAGDAVLAVARGEVGYVEGPDNSTKYWDWYGGNYGPWCGVFVMWCSTMAGYPCCTDTVLVSNGVWHGYTTAGSGATGVEAQRTVDLQPGDAVCFSWEPWAFEGGVPICQGEWQGYVAGDHIGIVATPPDANGWFSAVEGNTSDGSWDNGGMVMERGDRHVSQVCGWWRPEGIAAGGPVTPPQPTTSLLELGMFLLQNDRRGIWLMGPGYAYGLNEEEYGQVVAIPGMQTFRTGGNERAFDLIYASCVNGVAASDT